MACIDHGKKGDRKGYAYHGSRINGKQPKLHRLVYAQTHGLDEATMGGAVMHTCDNPRCINPEHLVLGTQAENVADMDAKGRRATGSALSVPSGSAHYLAKLTPEIVAHCRAVYVPRHREFGGRALAKTYGVQHSVMQKALNGATWA